MPTPYQPLWAPGPDHSGAKTGGVFMNGTVAEPWNTRPRVDLMAGRARPQPRIGPDMTPQARYEPPGHMYAQAMGGPGGAAARDAYEAPSGISPSMSYLGNMMGKPNGNPDSMRQLMSYWQSRQA